MTDAERADIKRWVDTWKQAGPLLDAQREEDVRRSDTVSNVAAFGRLWNEAVRVWPPEGTSGLVEQQRIFKKLRPA